MEKKEHEKCLFCNIIQKIEPAFLFYEDNNHIAFLSIFPNTEGFSIVTTKQHFDSDAFNQQDIILERLIIASKNVSKIIINAFDDVGRCGFILEGYGINHLHAKLFPMHGTSKDKKWVEIKSNYKKYFNTYDGYISSNDSLRATEKDLKKTWQLLVNSRKELLT